MCVFHNETSVERTKHLTQGMYGFSPAHHGTLLFGMYVYVCLSVPFAILISFEVELDLRVRMFLWNGHCGHSRGLCLVNVIIYNEKLIVFIVTQFPRYMTVFTLEMIKGSVIWVAVRQSLMNFFILTQVECLFFERWPF